MPFQELSRMHLRKQMVMRLRGGQLSVSEASREYGVSRNTVRLWLRRAEGISLCELLELSRRPHKVWRQTDVEIERSILALKAQRPVWGAKKIVAKLFFIPQPSLGLRVSLPTARRAELTRDKRRADRSERRSRAMARRQARPAAHARTPDPT